MESQTAFLRTVLADEGHLCLVAIRDGKTVQKFYRSVDDLLSAATTFDGKQYNVYFGLSTYQTEKSRSAKNTKLLQSLFLDIDCGVGKPYKNQLEGLEALKQFCKHAELPRPTAIVNSGRGLHVYWGLTKPQTRKAWTPVAEKLKSACKSHGLEADPVVTADAARILRVPDTHNFNADPAASVEVLGKLGERVELKDMDSALGTGPADTSILDSKRARGVTDRICGITYADKSFKKLLRLTSKGKGCKQIARAIKKPDEVSYATWTHLLSIVKFCDDTEDKHLHKVSKGYEHYDPEETIKVAESLKYPHTCDRFKDDYEKGCKDCPHYGKIQSPITLAMEHTEEAEAEEQVIEVQKGKDIFDLAPEDIEKHNIPEYPFPYFRKSGGGVYLRTEDKDGEEIDFKISDTDLYLTERVRDPISGPCFVVKHHTHRDGVAEFVIPSTKLSSKEEIRKSMGENGIHLLPHQLDSMMRYIGAWIEKLQKTVDEHEARTQFGWDKDFTSFAVGDRLITKDNISRNHPSAFTVRYFRYFDKLGTLDGYKKTLKFFDDNRTPALQFMIGTAFASPLMAFVDSTNGGIFHLFGQGSGQGKSTSQFVAAAAWGVPRKLVMQSKSTGNSIWNRAEVMKDISVWIDELSNRSATDISDFAYDVSQGQQKSRMSSKGQNEERYQGDEWNMVVGTSANIALSQKAQEIKYTPQGEAQRVMEFQPPKLFDDTKSNRVTLALNKNMKMHYGHAGPLYVQHLLQDIPGYQQRTIDMVDYLGELTGATPVNRIWLAMGATVLVGLQIAKELGFITWDLKNLEEWIVAKIKSLREMQKEMAINIKELIAEYYATHLRSVLRINSDQKGNIRPSHIPDQLLMRHEPDINRLYIMTTTFNRWCTERGLVIQSIKEMMEKEMGMKAKLVRMAKNTDMDFGPQRCYVVDYNTKTLEKTAEKMLREQEVKTDPAFEKRS